MSREDTKNQPSAASESDLRNVRDRVSEMEASVARIDERTKSTMSMVEEIRDSLGDVASQEELDAVKDDVDELQQTVSEIETDQAENDGKTEYRRWLIEALVGGGTLGTALTIGMRFL